MFLRTCSFDAPVSLTDLVEVDRTVRRSSSLLEGGQDTVMPVLNEFPHALPRLPFRYVARRDLQRKDLFVPRIHDTERTGTFGGHCTVRAREIPTYQTHFCGGR